MSSPQKDFVPDFFPGPMPVYFPGQIVRHRRYNYRGVVVDFDIRCLAHHAWYHAAQRQPCRDQPWYHVLVDGSDAITYAAEENLMADPARYPIRHPMVRSFFNGFKQGRYDRNDRKWGPW